MVIIGHISPLPDDLLDLGIRIEAVVATNIPLATLIKVWNELAYQLTVYCVEDSADVELL